MAFITPFYKKQHSATLGRCGLAWAFLLGLCLLLIQPEVQAASEPEVTQLRLQRSEEGIYLSALIRFDLSATVEEALLKGIPLFFVAEADVYRERWYWLDSRVIRASRSYRLAYQPLTRRWRMTIHSGEISKTPSTQSLSQSFDSLSEALRALQYLAQWRIAAAKDLEPDVTGRLEFSFRLDLAQLPRPFQIGAVGQADWTIAANRTQKLSVERFK